MILKQVLKQARGNGGPEIRIGVCAPLPREAPDLIRVLLDMISDADDGLPACVQPAFRCFLARENPLRFPNGVGYMQFNGNGYVSVADSSSLDSSR